MTKPSTTPATNPPVANRSRGQHLAALRSLKALGVERRIEAEQLLWLLGTLPRVIETMIDSNSDVEAQTSVYVRSCTINCYEARACELATTVNLDEDKVRVTAFTAADASVAQATFHFTRSVEPLQAVSLTRFSLSGHSGRTRMP